jgi:hypothetical protein
MPTRAAPEGASHPCFRIKIIERANRAVLRRRCSNSRFSLPSERVQFPPVIMPFASKASRDPFVFASPEFSDQPLTQFFVPLRFREPIPAFRDKL